MFKLVCVSIVTVCLQLTSGGVMKPDDSIKYPGPIKDRNGVPDECKDQNFCTIKPPDYPQEQFDKMFKGTKLGKLPNLVLNDSLVDFPNRQGGPGDEDDCRTTVTYEPLYKVRTKRGDWRTVVQAEQENYVQKVRLETCLKPQSKCFTRFGEIPGIETYCRQNYNDWELVVSDGKGGTETVTTSLPVCCSCHYKSVDLASRFGKPKEQKTVKGE
ncbi:uncharacterized protein LOC134649826 [Cydia amplana]|uniref:uncharacterized protein LOC134649826 n=1 Tax=Cydia amplana TaxID=1869771 RepID=UPI002FE5FB1F